VVAILSHEKRKVNQLPKDAERLASRPACPARSMQGRCLPGTPRVLLAGKSRMLFAGYPAVRGRPAAGEKKAGKRESVQAPKKPKKRGTSQPSDACCVSPL
jgi:hypothetical protein